jgi:hypothetical protein
MIAPLLSPERGYVPARQFTVSVPRRRVCVRRVWRMTGLDSFWRLAWLGWFCGVRLVLGAHMCAKCVRPRTAAMANPLTGQHRAHVQGHRPTGHAIRIQFPRPCAAAGDFGTHARASINDNDDDDDDDDDNPLIARAFAHDTCALSHTVANARWPTRTLTRTRKCRPLSGIFVQAAASLHLLLEFAHPTRSHANATPTHANARARAQAECAENNKVNFKLEFTDLTAGFGLLQLALPHVTVNTTQPCIAPPPSPAHR